MNRGDFKRYILFDLEKILRILSVAVIGKFVVHLSSMHRFNRTFLYANFRKGFIII